MPRTTFATSVRDPSPEPLSHLSILIEAACCYVASRGYDSEITYASTIEVATPILVADY